MGEKVSKVEQYGSSPVSLKNKDIKPPESHKLVHIPSAESTETTQSGSSFKNGGSSGNLTEDPNEGTPEKVLIRLRSQPCRSVQPDDSCPDDLSFLTDSVSSFDGEENGEDQVPQSPDLQIPTHERHLRILFDCVAVKNKDLGYAVSARELKTSLEKVMHKTMPDEAISVLNAVIVQYQPSKTIHPGWWTFEEFRKFMKEQAMQQFDLAD